MVENGEGASLRKKETIMRIKRKKKQLL